MPHLPAPSRRIKIEWHALKSYPTHSVSDDFATKVHNYFGQHNLDVILTEGLPLDGDPTTADAYGSALYNVIGIPGTRGTPTPVPGSSPGHLILGHEWKDCGGSALLGALLHPHRGFGVVFTNRTGINNPTFEQTCLHEIGHILNLPHRIGDAQCPSAMCIEADRSVDPVTITNAWIRFDKWDTPLHPLLPLLSDDDNLLSEPLNPADDPIYPWGALFRDPMLPCLPAADARIHLDLIPDRDWYQVATPFGFIVRASNRHPTRHYSLPDILLPHVGSLNLRITPPRGRPYEWIPRFVVCGSGRRRIAPGQALHTRYVIFNGRGGTLFRMPGRYTIEASLPGVSSALATITIAVRPRANSEEVPCGMIRHIARGAPRGHSFYTRRIEQFLRNRSRRRDPLLPYVALMLGRQLPTPRTDAERADLDQLLHCALVPWAPVATRLDAHILRVCHCVGSRQSRRRLRERLHRDLDAHLTADDHRRIGKQLRELNRRKLR